MWRIVGDDLEPIEHPSADVVAVRSPDHVKAGDPYPVDYAKPSEVRRGSHRTVGLTMSRRPAREVLRADVEPRAGIAAAIWQARLERTRRMVLASSQGIGLLISEIAALSGFREMPSFTRMFKRRYGTMPSEAQEAFRPTGVPKPRTMEELEAKQAELATPWCADGRRPTG